jgi:hypothetical protein
MLIFYITSRCCQCIDITSFFFAGRLKSNENLWVHYRLLIYPLCGICYFPWHGHQIERNHRIWVSLPKDTKRHWNCLSFEMWDWTTVPSIDSPALYRATTAPPDATHCVQYWNVLNETTVQFWKLAQLIFLRMHQNLIFVLLNSDTYNQRKFSSYDMQNTAFTNALEIWIFCKQIS